MPNCDVYDIDRDARKFSGGLPIVAHPPCRAWGRLRTFANPRPGEIELAPWAVDQVRQYGGVLEHPAASTLWAHCNLPAPGCFDSVGGWTLGIHQNEFGHRAEKATLLYIVGIKPKDLPEVPIVLGEASHVIQSRKRVGYRPHVSKAEREHTPPALAAWLVQVALRCANYQSLSKAAA